MSLEGSPSAEIAVRAIVGELQGYAQSIPTHGESLEQGKALNALVDELNAATGRDYSRFRIQPEHGAYGAYLVLTEYQSKVLGLLGRLEAEYGLKTPSPKGGESLNLSINNTLQQTSHVIVSNELREYVTSIYDKYPEGSKEQTFLGRLRASLGGVKDAAGLVTALASAATAAGISIEEVAKLFP